MGLVPRPLGGLRDVNVVAQIAVGPREGGLEFEEGIGLTLKVALPERCDRGGERGHEGILAARDGERDVSDEETGFSSGSSFDAWKCSWLYP